MGARRRFSFAAVAFGAAAFLSGCAGLPRNVRDEIAAERDRLPQAQREIDRTKDKVREAQAEASVAQGWSEAIARAQSELDRAKQDESQLEQISRGGGRGPLQRARALLREERNQREAALRDAESVETGAAHWADFRRNPQQFLTAMQAEVETLEGAGLDSLAQKVEKAEQDWPAKKVDLDARLSGLRHESRDADSIWRSIEPARQDAAEGRATPAETAELIKANDTFLSDVTMLTHGEKELGERTDQLYNAWDKILTDLDKSREHGDTVYRERIRTVTTHYLDVPAKQTRIATNEGWVDVSAGAFRSVENDLGMSIGHKDAGLYDSEASTTPEPPGFAYVAPPSVGSNQYGYWSHDGGNSVWHWLPEYLIMRELFWGHDYRPIVINEYNGYEQARRYGRTYYGQETPEAPPKYGTHGTYTQQRYANSRYAQSGGYASSQYANHPEAAQNGQRSMDRFGARPGAEPENGAGRRFGAGSGSEPSGRRFGSGSGAPSVGRRFGSGGGSQSFGKSFGRRR